MKSRFVSAVAVLICCAICAVVAIFGYSRYKAAQEENAAFGNQLLQGGQDQHAVLGTHMPDELPGGASSGTGEATATPRAGGQ